MDGLEQRLDSILSDPESMGKIMELAKSLGLSSSSVEGSNAQETHSPSPPDTTIPSMGNLGALLSSFSGQSAPDDKQTIFLKALRPYLRPERRDRLDRAIQTAKLVKTAKFAMRQFMP